MPPEIVSAAGDITQLVRSAGQLALNYFRTSLGVDNKAVEGALFDFDPVTEADRVVEQHLRAGLTRMFADHAIMGEEEGETGSGPIRWVIDPIDGTRAFIIGQPMWGTLLGLQIEHEPIAGWMYLPAMDEMYWAIDSKSELITNAATSVISTTQTANLSDAVMLCTHPSMFSPGIEQDRFNALDAKVKMTRYAGDCANYGYLAAGWADLVVENQLAPYDIIPLIPIVEGAGGIVTDLDGNKPTNGGFVVAGATPQIHSQALNVLNGG